VTGNANHVNGKEIALK